MQKDDKKLKWKDRVKAKQFFWDDETKEEFKRLCNYYDQDLALNVGILKLVREAIDKWHLPGYAKKDKPSHQIVENSLGQSVIMPKKTS